MDIKKELEKIRNHFENITPSEYQQNLEAAGAGEIKPAAESGMELAANKLQEGGLLYKADIEEVFQAIRRERAYQEAKWDPLEDHSYDVFQWFVIMTDEAEEMLAADSKEEELRELLQMIAVGVACLEQHGVYERPEEAFPETEEKLAITPKEGWAALMALFVMDDTESIYEDPALTQAKHSLFEKLQMWPAIADVIT